MINKKGLIMNEIDRKIKELLETLDTSVKIEGENSLNVAYAYGNLGVLYKDKGNYD